VRPTHFSASINPEHRVGKSAAIGAIDLHAVVRSAKHRALRFIARCVIFEDLPHHIGMLDVGHGVNLERRRLFDGNA
jgi:hypothetical protein